MATLLTGSIELSKISEAVKSGHSSVYTDKDGKKFLNIKVWHNEQPDKFGNDASIQLNPKKDKETTAVYLGNLKVRGGNNQQQTTTGQTTTAQVPQPVDEDIF